MLIPAIKYTAPFTLLWAIVLLSWGCRKDVDEIRHYPNTQTELSLFLKQVPDPATTTIFLFDGLNEDRVLETPGGVRVFLTDVDQLFSSKDSPSTAVACSTCPELKIVVTVANTKGDILARELSTYSNDDMLLESGGMVHLQAFCGTTALQLLQGRTVKVQLPANDAKDGMFVYTSAYDNSGFDGWEASTQAVFKADWLAAGGTGVNKGYELILPKLGWSNCARPLSLTSVTPFCVKLEPGYTGLNTQAYLVFDNILVVAPLKFDDTSHSFCFPNVPAGYPVRIVSVAKLDTAYWLGAATTETGTNSTLALQPQQKEALDLLGYLRGL